MSVIQGFTERAANVLGFLLERGRSFLSAASPREEGRSLIIIDDLFPNLVSAFRVAEYNVYLERFGNAKVYSAAASLPVTRRWRIFRKMLREYEACYPQFRGRVELFSPYRDVHCSLFYLIFLNNAFRFIDYLEKAQVPFVFTLYPGGGFHLHQAESDRKLQRVLSSPNFRKVVVTQKTTRQYLLEKGFCRAEQIEFVYGGVLPSEALRAGQIPRKRYGRDKETFDICFVAHKYMEKGIDKGFDLFVEVARKLRAAQADIRFHVVGSFEPADMAAAELEESVSFYGTRTTDFFPSFYSGMDIILSPNVPFVLAPGAFDGFPTGCCIEAGLCGVAVFCSDPLDLNPCFVDGEDIAIIPLDAQSVADRILEYYHAPQRLYGLAERCQASFLKVFDIEQQMQPRLDLLSRCMNETGGSSPAPRR